MFNFRKFIYTLLLPQAHPKTLYSKSLSIYPVRWPSVRVGPGLRTSRVASLSVLKLEKYQEDWNALVTILPDRRQERLARGYP